MITKEDILEDIEDCLKQDDAMSIELELIAQKLAEKYNEHELDVLFEKTKLYLSAKIESFERSLL